MNGHYKKNGGLEPIEVIVRWKLDFVLGNVIKYVGRHKWKGGKEDLEKAKDYLQMAIDNYEILYRGGDK